MNTIRLSDHFTVRRLLRFVAPSIVMMVFTSLYSVVDGLFVSNFTGKTPFAAVNLIMPVLMGLGTVGFMIGTGGSALVGMTLGLGEKERANRLFSMLTAAGAAGGVVLSVLGLVFLRPAAYALGARGEMLEQCVIYGAVMLVFQTFFILQIVFQSFFVTAEKPKLGLAVTVAAGLTNIVLDALLVGVFRMGVAGAAAATGVSQLVGGAFPLWYFARRNSSLLRFARPEKDWRALVRACANGASELMTNLSSSIVTALYNVQLMRFAGEDGVAAYGVIMYVNFIFNAIFYGYSIGSAPVFSYHYGAGGRDELKSLLRKSLALTAVCGAFLTLAAEASAGPLSRIFVGYDAALCAMTTRGFQLYALSFLVVGFNIFGSAFFTALNNGAVSAAISFVRTLVFQLLSIWLLPVWWGLDGVWLAVVAAELLALAVTASLFAANRRRYGYL